MKPGTLLLLLATLCMAQETHSDSGNLGRLPQDAKVRIIRPGDHNSGVTGLFRAWTPEGVTLARKDEMVSLKRSDVRMVFQEEKGSRLRSTLLGGVVGFIPGFILGAAAAGYIADQNNPRFTTRMEGAFIFGLLGAGIGSSLGAIAGGTKSTLIYRARER